MSRMSPDPRFPDRPTHPDFAKLSEVVLAMDARSESDDFDLEKDVGGVVDLESLTYMAHGRADLALNHSSARLLPPRSILAGAWMDAFVAGVTYARANP